MHRRSHPPGSPLLPKRTGNNSLASSVSIWVWLFAKNANHQPETWEKRINVLPWAKPSCFWWDEKGRGGFEAAIGPTSWARSFNQTLAGLPAGVGEGRRWWMDMNMIHPMISPPLKEDFGGLFGFFMFWERAVIGPFSCCEVVCGRYIHTLWWCVLKKSKDQNPQGDICTVDQMCRSRKDLWDVSVLLAQNFVLGCFSTVFMIPRRRIPQLYPDIGC